MAGRWRVLEEAGSGVAVEHEMEVGHAVEEVVEHDPAGAAEARAGEVEPVEVAVVVDHETFGLVVNKGHHLLKIRLAGIVGPEEPRAA